MWKNLLILFLLGVLACLWTDLMRFFERVALRDVVMLLLVVGTIGAITFIRHVVRRL